MQVKDGSTERSSSFTLAVDALLCALLILSCFVTIPVGPVPFTLQTAVMVAIVVLRRPRSCALITAAYLLMGTVGLPVFSGMSAGVVRATTGFLAGFFVGGVAASWLRVALAKAAAKANTNENANPNPLWVDAAAALIFLIIDYALGWSWYVWFAGVTWAGAFAIVAAPFLLPDAVKAVAAILVVREVRKRVPRTAE